MKRIVFIFLVLSTILSFCSENVIESEQNLFKIADTLTINYKEKLFNNEKELSIQFDSLLSDGRCPVDLLCFWEGDAELNFTFGNIFETVNFNLHTAGNYFARDTVLFGYRIRLVDVFPYPHSKKEVKVENYEAIIVIDKLIEE